VQRPAIGIFDSGIGGLTVAAEVARRLPAEDLIYLGDTARLPYGTKSAETVARYAERATTQLLRFPLKVVVVACNTASAHALPRLRALTDHPILGVVDPGAKAAVAATRSGRIGIAGTEATIRSGTYQAAIRAQAPEAQLTSAPWPLLVALAEEGWVDHPVAHLTLETYLSPFVDAGVDTLVLGCTHYPLFKGAIREVLEARFGGVQMTLVDSAEAVTAELVEILDGRGLRNVGDTGERAFFCTDLPERFARVGARFFPDDVSGVAAVDL
jgi:glutamate racemase